MPPKVLVVFSPQRQSRLLEILEGQALQIECAAGFLDAREKLGGPARYLLLLADAELDDGSWQYLIQFAQCSGTAAAGVICARLEAIGCGRK